MDEHPRNETDQRERKRGGRGREGEREGDRQKSSKRNL